MIFIKSLQEGIVPKDFRMANITPIFKKGDRKMPNNYRPISLTSIVRKIFEAILTNRLVAHFEERNLLNSSQHGFRRNRLCLTNFLEIFDVVVNTVDICKEYAVIYLRLSKSI